jgi:hypothetical protein
MSNYLKFRGKCKEMSEEAVLHDPSLSLVRGFYYCPIWNKREQHWWTERIDGTIYDPTKNQFPSAGNGIYEKFDGFFDCEECGKKVIEEEIFVCGNHLYCSSACCAVNVGL